MDETAKGFMHLIHIGEDIAWYRDHRSVVAVGNGLVRQVRRDPTWGNIVVIEHRSESGEKFSSLYAHLGSFVSVRPGAIVEKGRKIGVIGRSFTLDNGGYPAHLHFAIHMGDYSQIHKVGSIIDVKYRDIMYRGRVIRSDPVNTMAEIYTWNGPLVVNKTTSWVCGYISEHGWKEGKHNWVEPQGFIRARLGSINLK